MAVPPKDGATRPCGGVAPHFKCDQMATFWTTPRGVPAPEPPPEAAASGAGMSDLLFVDGLTLAGARRRLSEEGLVAPDEEVHDADVAAMLDADTRQGLRDVRRGLQWILGVLDGDGITDEDRVLAAAPSRNGRGAKPAPKKTARKKR